MGRPITPSPTAYTVPIVIPRGHDHYWRVIRAINEAGPWTAAEVVARSNAHRASIHDFIGRLEKAGLAEQVASPDGKPSRFLRLTESPYETPRLRRDGTAAPPSAQQHMWTAMRRLGQFTFRDIAYHASTDLITIGDVTAKSYIARLSAAGYLAVVVKGGPAKPAVYRVKPSMADGRPKAPRVLRSHLVYDPNIDAVVGEAIAEEIEP